MWTVFAIGYPECPIVVGVEAATPVEAVAFIVGEWVPVASDGVHEVPLMVHGGPSPVVVTATVTVVDDVVVTVSYPSNYHGN